MRRRVPLPRYGTVALALWIITAGVDAPNAATPGVTIDLASPTGGLTIIEGDFAGGSRFFGEELLGGLDYDDDARRTARDEGEITTEAKRDHDGRAEQQLLDALLAMAGISEVAVRELRAARRILGRSAWQGV